MVLNDTTIETAYITLITGKDYKGAKVGFIAMDELFKYLRATTNKSLTLAQFKAYMQDFYKRRSPNSFEFSRGSSSRAEVKRYAFLTAGRWGGLHYYMRAVPDASGRITKPIVSSSEPVGNGKAIVLNNIVKLRTSQTIAHDDIIIETAYNTLINAPEYNHARGGYIGMDELFKHIRATTTKSLDLARFKFVIRDFYTRRCPDDYEFARATILRSEVRRYAFDVPGKYGGLFFYMRLIPK